MPSQQKSWIPQGALGLEWPFRVCSDFRQEGQTLVLQRKRHWMLSTPVLLGGISSWGRVIPLGSEQLGERMRSGSGLLPTLNAAEEEGARVQRGASGLHTTAPTTLFQKSGEEGLTLPPCPLVRTHLLINHQFVQPTDNSTGHISPQPSYKDVRKELASIFF